MKKGYCCKGFASWYSDRGKKGLSIDDHDNPEAPYKIVGLAADQSDIKEVIEMLLEGKVRYNLRLEMTGAISFCPWCGKKLASH